MHGTQKEEIQLHNQSIKPHNASIIHKLFSVLTLGLCAISIEAYQEDNNSFLSEYELYNLQIQNLKDFFGTSGFLVDASARLFESFNNLISKKNLNTWSVKKKITIGIIFVSLIIAFSHAKTVLIKLLDKKLLFKFLLGLVFSFILMCIKIAFKNIAKSHIDDLKNDRNKYKKFFLILAIIIAISALFIALDIWIVQNNKIFESSMILQSVFAALMMLFCYSIFSEICVYHFFFDDKIKYTSEYIKNKLPNFLIKKTIDNKEDKELNLFGKFLNVIFLGLLTAIGCCLGYFVDTVSILNNFERVSKIYQFIFRNFKEIIASIISFILIYSYDVIDALFSFFDEIKNLLNFYVFNKEANNNIEKSSSDLRLSIYKNVVLYAIIGFLFLIPFIVIVLEIVFRSINEQSIFTKFIKEAINLNLGNINTKLLTLCLFLVSNFFIAFLGSISNKIEDDIALLKIINSKNSNVIADPNLKTIDNESVDSTIDNKSVLSTAKEDDINIFQNENKINNNEGFFMEKIIFNIFSKTNDLSPKAL
jgi:hypothetical protein